MLGPYPYLQLLFAILVLGWPLGVLFPKLVLASSSYAAEALWDVLEDFAGPDNSFDLVDYH